MKKHGHFGISLLLSTPIVVVTAPRITVLIVSAVLITTQLPNAFDLSVFKRRGGSHNVWFSVVVALFIGCVVFAVGSLIDVAFERTVNYVVLGEWKLILTGGVVVGVLVGMVSHFIGDIIVGNDSKPGVKLFWPVKSRRVKIGYLDNESPVSNEYLFMLGGGLFIVSVIVKYWDVLFV